MQNLNLCPILFAAQMSRGCKRSHLLNPESPNKWMHGECVCLGEACQWFIEGDCAVIPVGTTVEVEPNNES